MTPQHALIVDDDALQRAMLASMLQQLGCHTLESPDPKTALTLLHHTPSINIVFTDVLLPWMSGISFLQRVRESHPHLPVVVLSASNFSVWGEDALKSGATFCLQIPFFKNDLIMALEAGQTA